MNPIDSDLTLNSTNCLLIVSFFFLISWVMDSYRNHLPAKDSTNIGGQSLALKAGAAGSLLYLLAFIIYVFLKRCDSCTIKFKMRAGGASSRPVEEAWNKEVGCNHNKLAYIYIYQRTSRMKWCLMFLMFLLSMTCFAALPFENGNWQFEVPWFYFFMVTLKNLIVFLVIECLDPIVFIYLFIFGTLSLSLSRFINFYLRYVPVVSSVSYKWLNWLCSN